MRRRRSLMMGSSLIAPLSFADDRETPLVHVADGAAADIGLAYRLHADRRQDARRYALALERTLHGKRIDDGGEHAHVVGGRALHALGGAGQPTEDVAAADDEANLGAQ